MVPESICFQSQGQVKETTEDNSNIPFNTPVALSLRFVIKDHQAQGSYVRRKTYHAPNTATIALFVRTAVFVGFLRTELT